MNGYDHKAGQKARLAGALQTLAILKLGSSVAHGASKPTVIGDEEALSEQRGWAGPAHDSSALNSGDSCGPKGSLSWNKPCHSITWHKRNPHHKHRL